MEKTAKLAEKRRNIWFTDIYWLAVYRETLTLEKILLLVEHECSLDCLIDGRIFTSEIELSITVVRMTILVDRLNLTIFRP